MMSGDDSPKAVIGVRSRSSVMFGMAPYQTLPVEERVRASLQDLRGYFSSERHKKRCASWLKVEMAGVRFLTKGPGRGDR
jgi:hypothetical protein